MPTVRADRQVDAARRELYGRRVGRAGVALCPGGCGTEVVVVRYVPKSRYTGDDPADFPRARRQPARRRRGGKYSPAAGDAPLMVFEFRSEARTNDYANYATTSSWLTARLLDNETPPLEDREIRACLHIARHPECSDFLTRPKA